MHPTILHAIQNRRDFELELSGGRLKGRAGSITLHGGASFDTYEVTYMAERILKTSADNHLMQYRFVIDDATFASDVMVNRAIRVNAVSDALAEALGL